MGRTFRAIFTKRETITDMPIYEYYCKKCNKTFEKFQKTTEKPLERCPECGNEASRVISKTTFALKGDGWYKDGYTTKCNGHKADSSSTCKSGDSKATASKPDKSD